CAAKHIFHHRGAGFRVLHNAGGDPDTAGTAGLRRSVADVDAALERAVDQHVDAVAGADEDEIRAALYIRQAEPIARGVEQRLRLADLPEVPIDVIAIAEPS